MKTKIRKILFYALMLRCIAAIVFGAWLFIYAETPIDATKDTTVLVDIPTGTSFFKVAKILGDVGLIKNRFLFYGLVGIKGSARSIRAGEYEFNTSFSPSELIDKLLYGDIKFHRVTIREDYSLKEVAAHLKEYKLIDEKVFFQLAQDREFLLSLRVAGPSLEGYLFPDTYFLNRSMSTRQIMRSMVERFWNKISPQMINQAATKGLDPHQFVTFASLIGKESGNSAEKPVIAAVFYNRMRKGIPLQSDPTTIYDLKDFSGKILRSHYRRESPYNTYIIKGLPPGPIANPGLDSFLAILSPAKVDSLFFVSQNDGTHYGSSSLSDHLAATKRFRSGVTGNDTGSEVNAAEAEATGNDGNSSNVTGSAIDSGAVTGGAEK